MKGRHMRIVRWQGRDGIALALRDVAGSGQTVLFPTHAARRSAYESASESGVDLSDYETDILAPWVVDLWRRFGDGTQPIASNDRISYLWQAFDNRQEAGKMSLLRRNKGTLALAEAIGSRAAAWLPEEGSEKDMALELTSGQRELVGLAREYDVLIRKAGLADVDTIYKRLPSLLADTDVASKGVVLVGFDQMGFTQQTLVKGLDDLPGGVTLLLRAHEGELLEAKRERRDDGTYRVESVPVPGSLGFHVQARASRLLDDLSAMGVALDYTDGCYGTVRDASEGGIPAIVNALATQDASEGVPCRSLDVPLDGSLSLLNVAGETAQDAALARMALERAEHGSVAVIGTDAYQLWEHLAPRLVSGRLDASGTMMPPARVSAEVSVPIASVRTASVLVSGLRQVVTLSGLLSASEREQLGLGRGSSHHLRRSAHEARSRHQDEQTTAGWFMELSREVLGEMSWWPPDQVLDLMSVSAMGVPVATVTRLRMRWAKDRRLSPHAVLSTMTDPEQVGARMAGLAKAAADGHMKQVFATMARILSEGPGDRGADAGSAVMTDTSVRLAAIAMSAIVAATKGVPDPVPGDAESVERYFTCLSQILSHDTLDGTLLAEPDGMPPAEAAESDAAGSGAHSVSLLSLSDVTTMLPESYGTVILAEQDSVTSAVPRDDNLRSTIMGSVGCGESASNMADYRADFLTAVSLARDSVVFERVLRKSNGKHVTDTFPSVGLGNVALAYEGGFYEKVLTREESEIPFVSNMSLDGHVPDAIGTAFVSPLEECSDESAETTWASRRRSDGEVGQIVLSASDVDAYAKCPYRWFVERILKTSEPTEALPPYAFGSFAHAVLEDVHGHLIQQAAQAVADGSDDRFQTTPYAVAMAGDGSGGYAPKLPSGPVPSGYDKGMPGTRIGGKRQTTPEDASAEIRRRIRDRYEEELAGQSKAAGVPVLPLSLSDAVKLDATAQSVEGFPAYEARMFWRNQPDGSPLYFSPRFVELKFGEEYGRPVTIGGVPFHGSIDRIDVNRFGECIIMDYKHSSSRRFSNSYSITRDWSGDDTTGNQPSGLQLLVYALALRSILPDLKVVGLVYVGTRHPYAVSGVLDDDIYDATDAKGLNIADGTRMTSVKGEQDPEAPLTVEQLIDYVTPKVHEYIADMFSEEHASHASDKCMYCDMRGLCLSGR